MAENTSPSTAVGKHDPSRNALKRGIFSNTLQEDEDAQDVEAIVDDLINRFDASDAAGEICARRLVQTTLQIKRLNQAQLDYVEGYMQGEPVRQEFCRQVGLQISISKNLPWWYFESDADSRTIARSYAKAQKEAIYLKNNYSVDKLTNVKVLFPTLWIYLMGEEGSAIQKVHSFGDRLASLYKKSTPFENLQSLIDEISSEQQFDLVWAENEYRFELVVGGLRAQATLDAMSNANWARADSLFHRRSQDLLQTLVSLKHEKNRSEQPALEVLETTKPKRKSKALAKDVEPKKDA